MSEFGNWPEGPQTEPTDSMTGDPPEFGEARHTVLSPSGGYESSRDLLRGLGSRRVRIAMFAGGGVLLLLALLAALR